MGFKFYLPVIIGGLIGGMFISIFPLVTYAVLVCVWYYVFKALPDDDDVCSGSCDK